jgi:hypothetical protein
MLQKIIFLLFALLVWNSASHAWWDSTHQAVSRQAVVLLPEPLQTFFKQYQDQIIAHSGDSDKLRKIKKHANDWLDMEAVTAYPFNDLPKTRDAAYARFTKDSLENAWGMLPWNTADEYRALVEAFRKKDAGEAIRIATHLSHHIADAHMPFHTTLNHDGSPLGTRGVHVRIEGTVEHNLDKIRWQGLLVPATLASPFDTLLLVLNRSNGRIFQLLYWDQMAFGRHLKDKELKAEQRYPEYEGLIMEKLGGLFNIALSEAAVRLAQFWYAAWVEAGQPALKAVPGEKILWEVDQ